MTIEHTGEAIPVDPVLFDPNGEEWVETAWDEDVAIHGDIQTSTWIVPTGWTVEASEGPVPISANGVDYTNGTRARLTTTQTSGTYVVTNRVTFNNSTSLDRSRKLKVAQA